MRFAGAADIALLVFLLSDLVLGQHGDPQEKEKVSKLCFQKEKASKKVKSWVKHVLEEETQNYDMDFYDTTLSVVEDSDSVRWVIVSDGLQGAFYFENTEEENLQERHGAYLYPDYSTAIVGVWKDHLLVHGRTTQLVEACMSGNSWTLQFGELEGPVMAYSPPSHYSYGVHPLQRDPYESRTVQVRKSEEAGAQDGLFTAREVLSGEVLAFYSGLIIYCESSLRALDRRELSDEEEHVRNMYNIALDIGDEDDNLCIDIPPEMGNDVNKYNATLGHKVNHSFTPNSEFVLFTAHPVLGTIMALTALKDMPAMVEISVNYGYNFTTEPDQPQWFKTLWKQFHPESKSDHEEL